MPNSKAQELDYFRQLERYCRKYMRKEGDVTELVRGIRSTLRSLAIVRKDPTRRASKKRTPSLRRIEKEAEDFDRYETPGGSSD